MAQTIRTGAAISGHAVERGGLEGLLAATAEGDRTAFAELYRMTSGKLLGTAIRILGDRGAAEDVLQETYLRIWQNAHRFDAGLGSALGWLTTILRHRAIDRARILRASRENAVGGDTDLEAAASEPPSSPEHRMADGQSISRCLERLDARRRTLILLAFTRGFTHVELAARMALPLGTVKSDIRRGLKELRTCLDA